MERCCYNPTKIRAGFCLLGKNTLEAEILKEALEHATGSKKQPRLPSSPPKDGSSDIEERGARPVVVPLAG
jgi:hypothetical protein